MNKELETYYEDRFSMMATQGWKDLIEDMEEMLKAADSLNGVNDEKTLHFKKGEVSIMNWIIGLKKISEEAYEGLKNESIT